MKIWKIDYDETLFWIVILDKSSTNYQNFYAFNGDGDSYRRSDSDRAYDKSDKSKLKAISIQTYVVLHLYVSISPFLKINKYV